MVEHSNQFQPNRGPRPPAPPCRVESHMPSYLSIIFASYVIFFLPAESCCWRETVRLVGERLRPADTHPGHRTGDSSSTAASATAATSSTSGFSGTDILGNRDTLGTMEKCLIKQIFAYIGNFWQHWIYQNCHCNRCHFNRICLH